MREYNALKSYPKSGKTLGFPRTIRNRLIASYRDDAFFDGDRLNGYGGYRYDGRWADVARDLCEEYRLDNKSQVLQVQCEKGFLLYELLKLNPLMRVRGTETSVYARNEGMNGIRLGIRLESPTRLPFNHKEFDLVLALGVVYTLNLADAVKTLAEITRVGKRSFVTLAAYETEEDLKLFKDWSLLGTTILKKDEWREVLIHAGYQGDYCFVTAESLGLCAC